MKKFLLTIGFLFVLAIGAQAQTGCVELREIDGAPDVKCVKIIRVTNGTLSCTGTTCTITISGGGGGSPGGADTNVQFNDSASFGGNSGFVYDKTSKISLGVAGASVGAIGFRNATSGTITLQPVTGALGTVTLSLPAVTDTLVGLAATQTLTNKTLASPSVTGNISAEATSLLFFGGNYYRYINGTGPATYDVTTDMVLTFNVQSLTDNRTVTWPDTALTVAGINVANSWSAGVKQTFAPNGTTAGINVGSVAGDPSAPANGDLWYDSTANELTARINGANVALGGGSSGITVNTTPVTGGTATRLFYETAGNVVGQISTLTSDGTIVTFAPTVTTGTGATAGVVGTANSLTTGNGFDFSSSSVSSGNVFSIAATGTAAASNTKTALFVSASGANATSTQTTYAGRYSNTSTGTTSVNYGLHSTASGGTTNVPFMATTGTTSITVAFYALGGENGTGLTYPSAAQAGIVTSGTERLRINSVGVTVAANLRWGSGASSYDTSLRRAAAASLVFGDTDAASPVAQTLSVQNVVGGTSNTAGATWTLRGSLGTSQGAPGRIHLTGGAMIAASGTTQQTAVDRIISGATKVLTNNSATTIVNVTNATETSAGGVLDYCVEVTDGVDTQYECGMATYGISNKAGVFSGNTVTKFGNHQNATSGTLTVTFAISGANPGALSINANSSLSPSTGYPRVVYSLRNLGNQAVAVQ